MIALVKTLLFAAIVVFVLANVARADENSDNSGGPSELAIMPYVWATGIKGSIGFGELSVDLDLPIQDLATDIEAGGMGLARWKNDKVALNFEAIRLEYKDSEFESLFNQRVSSDLTFLSSSVGRVFDFNFAGAEGDITVNLGVNYTEINGVISGELGSQRIDESWLDPTIGYVLELPIDDHWRLFAKTDLSGVILSDNTLFSSLLVVQRDISSTFQVNVGYRYADADYPSPTGFDLQLEGHGPLIGISARFGT